MSKNKTFIEKKEEITRQWHKFDAKGQVLGHLASEIAQLLIGKHKVTYTPHNDGGDYVVVVNAEKIEVTRNKANKKIYYRHSGFPGGIKQRTFAEMIEKNPTKVIELAVKNMLPKNRLRDQRLARLKIIVGDQHPYKNLIKAK
jgi:large subunit ribosomal protein L13